MTYKRYYYWEEKPLQINTKSRWQMYGYGIRKNAPVISELKTGRRAQRASLSHCDDIIPMRGKVAMHKRYMVMLKHFRSKLDKELLNLLNVHPNVTPDALHDFIGRLVDEGRAALLDRSFILWCPQDSYFGHPFFQDITSETKTPHLDTHYQQRLKNSALEFIYEAIDSGYYHQKAQENTDKKTEQERREALELELKRQVEICVPLHPLSDHRIDETMKDKDAYKAFNDLQIDKLVNPEKFEYAMPVFDDGF